MFYYITISEKINILDAKIPLCRPTACIFIISVV